MDKLPGSNADHNVVVGTELSVASRESSPDPLKMPAWLIQAAMFTSCVILSAGLVLALLLFVQLSFENPNAATILVPLILGPIGAVVVTNAKKLAQDYLERRRANSSDDPAIDQTEPQSQLIERLGELAIDCKRAENERLGQPVECVCGSCHGSSRDLSHVPALEGDRK